MGYKGMKTWRLIARILWGVAVLIAGLASIVEAVALLLASHLSDSISLTMNILMGTAMVLLVAGLFCELVWVFAPEKKRGLRRVIALRTPLYVAWRLGQCNFMAHSERLDAGNVLLGSKYLKPFSIPSL